MANPMYGSNKFDSKLTDAYFDYCSGFQGNLSETGIEVTQAEGVAGVKGGDETLAEVDAATFIAGAVNTFAGTGAAATSSYLPPATKGTHLVVEVTGDIDQTGKWSIHCNNSVGTVKPVQQVLAKQVIGHHNGATAMTVETAGSYDLPTSTNLEYTAAAADTNLLGAGSVIHFFAPVNGEWLVKINPISEGTGATGALAVS